MASVTLAVGARAARGRTEEGNARKGGSAPWPAVLGSGSEDYLVGIAALAESGEAVFGARLAKLLRVSEPSVTQMVHRLAGYGLASRSSPGTGARPGIELTAAGASAAAWLLTRRRVCECFFIDGIGLDWPTALQAANQMEHGLSFEATERLHQGLGAPTTCPHGNRIELYANQPIIPVSATRPSAGSPGVLDPRPDLLLASTAVGSRVVVEQLLGPIEQDLEALRMFQEEGITPGQAILVERAVPQTSALSVRRGRRRCIVPARLSAYVGVQPWPAQHTAPARKTGDPLPPPCRPEGAVRLTAVRVEGPCPSGHAGGDCFMLGHRTPAGLCGATYAAMLPLMKRMLASPESAAAPDVIERRCPGDGYVVWRLERVSPTPRE